ncbi:MAG: PEP-CTERM sorting domain-containing protein [Planctomycetota bacterium]
MLSMPCAAGTLTGGISVENAATFTPGTVPDPPGFFNAGNYGLVSSEPFRLNLTASGSGSTESYTVLISFVNLTSETIEEFVVDIDGPAQFGGLFPLELGPVYGPAEDSSPSHASFLPDIEWGDTFPASMLFELEVLDPVQTPDITLSFSIVPEPSTAALVLLGLAVTGRRTTRGHRRH